MKERVILLTVLLLVGVVEAGSISMSVSTETVFFPANMSISLQNSGDEFAENVRLSFLSDNFKTDDVSIGKLNANQERNLSLIINRTGDILPGSYPVVILTRYEDANGYPFSSVSPNYIVYEEMTTSDIYATLQDTELAEDSTITLKIRNLGNEELESRIKLFLPLEIISEKIEDNISISPKSEKEVAFKISNFGALVGSSYVVLAALEYENALHHSSIFSGMVEIIESQKSQEHKETNKFLLYIIFIIVVLVITAYFYSDIKKMIKARR